MQEIGWASLGVVPVFDGKKLDADANKAMLTTGDRTGGVFGDAAGKTAGSRFGTVFKSAAKAGLVGVGALAVGAFKLASDSVSAASDLEESTNKVSQVFGKAADDVFRFTETAADRLGQTNTAARDAAATFGIFGSAAGLSDRKSAKFAKRMTTLASDLASFNNTEPDEAVQALGAALRGESEPIRAYGVLLDEATLKAEAMRLGLLEPVKDESKIRAYQVRIMEGQKAYNEAVDEHGEKSIEALKAEANLGTLRESLRKATEGTIPPLTQQQKLLAAQSEIFKQTSVAQGDFERTSDGLANQQRRLKARFEDAKAALGKGLLPIMTQAADWLLNQGLPKFEKFSAWFSDTGIPKIKTFGGHVEDAAGQVKDLVGWLDDLPKPAKFAGVMTLIGGISALKLRGGNGAIGTVGKALGLAKPVPVFVTNPGFGAGGGKGPMGGVGAAPPKPGSPVIPRSVAKFGLGAGALFTSATLAGADEGAQGQNSLLYDLFGFNPLGIGKGEEMPKLKIETLGEEKVLDLKDGLVSVKDTMEEAKASHERLLSSLDKTPRQLEVEFRSKGYQELLDQIWAIRNAGAGGLPNSSSEATPRGFGSTPEAPAPPRPTDSAPIFSGPVTIRANDMRDVERQGREMQRKAAAGGFR